MANLGICKKCKSCSRISPSLFGKNGRKLSSAQAYCKMFSMFVEWFSEVTEKCPYRLEHVVTDDSFADLAEEAKKLKGRGKK